MRFFEIIDDAGLSFYRWDPEFEILYFWNEVDGEWQASIFDSPDELSRYILDSTDVAALREVLECDVHKH